MFAIKKTLNLSCEQYHYECFSTSVTKEEFTEKTKMCDVILTQAIHDNYRDRDYLSTSYILQTCSPDCRIVMVESFHFDFYYPDLTYLTLNEEMVTAPCSYHYVNMYRYFKQKREVSEYVHDHVNNFRVFSADHLLKNASKSLHTLTNRYENNVATYSRPNVTILSCRKFIEANYKKMLLFYTVNHPTKHLIKHVCNEICKQLNISPQLLDVDEMAKTKCILYKCLQPLVDFPIQNENVYKTVDDYFFEYRLMGKDINKIKYKSI